MVVCPTEIGNRIRNERTKLRYTQEQFSERLSIGRVHLANIEAGRKMASIDLLVAIADVSNCSLDYLVLGKRKSVPECVDLLQQAIDLLQTLHRGLL